MLLVNANLATMTDHGYGLIHNGAIRLAGNRIAWTGRSDDLDPDALDADTVLDLKGKLVTPGLIDCHTHLVYAGNRAMEFEQRLQGAGYREIARLGGGILSTVRAVRGASEKELVAQSRPRLAQLMSEGVTTVEIKSGYGLDTQNEIKMLCAAESLANLSGVRLQKTFLGAHALPPEFANRQDDYIDRVCTEMLPAAFEAGVVDAVDVFAEGIAFSVEQAAKVLDAALKLGLPIKLHAEQLNNLGGAAMAAGKGALSVDHLEYLEAGDCAALSRAGTVAVLLPGAFYCLRETRLPPVQALRDHRVNIAVATDCNPGSSPVCSPLLVMNMACTLFSLTPAEALRGMTVNAARALGMADTVGTLSPGKKADLAIWNTANPADLSYHAGLNLCHATLLNGHWHKPCHEI
ncbi:MAG: imidazolonepropionase [Gammaproteobacteria bacterium]|nr:imidazolonepropionase [Gammaproteobacteria bacterium]